MSRNLFVVETKNGLITHDGEFQLGFFRMSLEDFLKKVGMDYQVTYWLPDPMGNRYKRSNYQKHLKSASIGSKEDTLQTGTRFC
jgi:hypothetical protein